MKKLFIIFLIIGVTGLISGGCAKRMDITSIEKDRVDQDISSGNKGFISGDAPPQEQAAPRAKTRKIYQVTLELPPYAEWKNFQFEPTVDKELWGNRGYIYGGPQTIEPLPDEPEPQEAIVLPEETSVFEIEDASDMAPVPVAEPASDKISYSTYTVQKGDTLQKISRKKYGTTKRWKKIFDFNHDVLKNPNKIYPGQKIKIPQQ